MTVNVRKNFRSAGFTLVEVIVSLTLFSLVLVMVFNGLYSAGISWQKGEAQADINDTQRLVSAFLRRQLSQAVPLILIDGKDNPVLFKGGHDSLRFVSGLPAHRGGGGLDMLDIRIQQRKTGKNLVLAYQPVRPETDLFNDVEQENLDTLVLLKGVDEIEFSYYGNQQVNDKSGWHDDWESNDHLPEMVRMQITPGNPRQYWPEIVVPIQTQGIKGQPQWTLNARRNTGGNR